MNKVNALYFCCHCKKVCSSVEELLFVEETSSRGFCCEKCIEDFYTPLIDHYAHLERVLRKDHNCFDEPCLAQLNVPKNIEETLSYPDAIWRLENELGDEVYSFSKAFRDESGGQFHIAILCMVFNHKPSFIFMATATSTPALLAEFTTGDKIENPLEFLGQATQPLDAESLDQERLHFMEQKKSGLLASLLSTRKEADIKYEQFHLYDEFFQETLDSPDEIYLTDYEGDDLFVYIKAHDRDAVSFYYIVLCVRVPDSSELMIPVLSFPTLDPALRKHYQQGKRVSGNLIN